VAISSCGGSPAQGPCGPTIEKSSGRPWVCTFADDFEGGSLNRAKWSPMTTATTSFTQALNECYVDDPAHIRVADGDLTLTATKPTASVPCGLPVRSPYLSGMVTSKYGFAQTYGRFEVRARLPRDRGFQPALWMYPHDLTYGDRSGEIDIAESFGIPDLVAPHIHVHDATGADHPQGADCHVANASGEFHTYAVEWLPSSITFLYDGAPCAVIRNWQTGPPLVAPQPFDKPFFMALQLAIGFGANAPTAQTHFPAELTIDYVRAWR
jgi:beta-glucanase (GH16 family)